MCSFFADGKMTVMARQVFFRIKRTSVTEKYYNGAYYVNLQYETSEGNSSIAQFSFLKKTIAKQFVNTIVLFMGDGLQPESSTIDSSEPVVEDLEIETPAPTIDTSECTGPSILCF